MDRHYRIAIPFRDIDMHGHMHNAAHVSHFEAAISHFIRLEGLSEHFSPGGPFVFHVRRVDVQFHAPSCYDEDIEIACHVGRLGRSSLSFVPRMTGLDGKLRATADIIWVCVARQSSAPTSIPDPLRALLEPHIIPQKQRAE